MAEGSEHDGTRNEAWVTLATNDSYSMGALVLSSSLKRVNTTRSKVILVTRDVSPHMMRLLQESFDEIKYVDLIDSNDERILSLMNRPELGVTLTKIHCWSLTQYTKCVFLDADTLCLQNADELFDREELSAVPDIGWPDCFNSGVFVFNPSMDTFKALVELASVEGSFDGGDQGLLNSYFNSWFTDDSSRHLSFVYNMTQVATYSYPPAYRKFGHTVKIVHFLGGLKPWMYGFNGSTKKVTPSQTGHPQQLDHVQSWWDIFVADVQSKLSEESAGVTASFRRLSTKDADHSGPQAATSSSEGASSGSPHPDDVLAQRKMWESGNIDYLGTDSFDSIQKKLDDTIGQGSS